MLCDGVNYRYVGNGCTLCNDDEMLYPNTLDIYHPDNNTWDTIDTPHCSFAVTVLTGKIVVIGGYNRNCEITNKILVYILESGQWKDYTEMSIPRYNVTAISHQQMMIVMGGIASMVISTTDATSATLASGSNMISLNHFSPHTRS